VQASLETAGARVLIVRDLSDLGFVNIRTLTEVKNLSSVDSAIGLGLIFDSTNGRIGRGGIYVSTWPVYGDLSDAVLLFEGRWPAPGEALVSASAQTRLGLAEPVGFLSAGIEQYPIVGQYECLDGFQDLCTGAMINANTHNKAKELRVIISSISAATVTQTAVLSILAPSQTSGVSVQSPQGLADLSQLVTAQLQDYSRTIFFLAFGSGGLFVGAVVLADVLLHQRDLGRRRTLGISRMDLTALITVRAGIPASLGAVLGCLVTIAVTSSSDYTPGADFVLAVGFLSILVACLAAISPALYAAHVDPVRVMRTP
jgi:putative ABC transport system permease protein